MLLFVLRKKKRIITPSLDFFFSYHPGCRATRTTRERFTCPTGENGSIFADISVEPDRNYYSQHYVLIFQSFFRTLVYTGTLRQQRNEKNFVFLCNSILLIFFFFIYMYTSQTFFFRIYVLLSRKMSFNNSLYDFFLEKTSLVFRKVT